MNEERKLQAAVISLLREPEFALWGGVLMVGKTEISDTCPTATTNGRDKWFGREFVKSLLPKELAFVVLHEGMHCALRQLIVWRKLFEQDARLANIAADHVINLMIMSYDKAEKFVSLPKRNGKVFVHYDERFTGMSTKQVFDILKKEKQEKRKREGTDGQPGKPGDGEPGDDEGEGSFDHHDWEGAKDMPQEEQDQLKREIEHALRSGEYQHAQQAGKGAGGRHRELGDLLEPQISWEDALREFITSNCNRKTTTTWARPNRRLMASGIIMPSMIGESIGHVVVGPDMSGSVYVTPKMIELFLTEVRAICETLTPDRLDVVYWDTQVAGHEVYKSDELDGLVGSTKPKGGGGTDPRCVSAYLRKEGIKPDCIVMLTDGYINDWGNDWDAPVLWVVVDDGNRIVSPVGKTAHISQD